MNNNTARREVPGNSPSPAQWSNWQRRCFIGLVTVLELALITGLVIGLIVLSSLFEGS